MLACRMRPMVQTLDFPALIRRRCLRVAIRWSHSSDSSKFVAAKWPEVFERGAYSKARSIRGLMACRPSKYVQVSKNEFSKVSFYGFPKRGSLVFRPLVSLRFGNLSHILAPLLTPRLGPLARGQPRCQPRRQSAPGSLVHRPLQVSLQ